MAKEAPKPVVKTKEQKVHQFLSDVFLISNEAGKKDMTFLYEYCGEGKMFTLEDLDDVLMSRLSKNIDENKFLFLFQSFNRVQKHLYVKGKIIEKPQDILETITSYFMTCLQCPETFNLPN